jgi:polyphosphate kinase
VRLEVEASMPREMCESLLRELQFASGDSVSTLSAADVYPVDGLVDLYGLEEISDLPLEEMRYPPLERSFPLDRSRPVWDVLSEGDVLLRFPHDSFEETVERVLAAAATDERVVSVKITLYRTSRSSQVVRLLRTARRAGKDVLAVVELKASFDEQRNIEWARKLESAGIHVVYGPAQLKVHAKVMLVVRREEDGLKRYVYIGTGNLNAATAAAYTDLGLFTEDETLGEELQDVFNGLTGYAAPTAFEKLLVAPFNMRDRFLELIAREVEHAESGAGGSIRVKINGLTDPEVIAALYRASQAGVRCELVVRGLCSLRPGVPGLSENITVRSILGRFLEHARIYEFANAGQPEYFIGSADWRPRNLSRRVEIVTPVAEPAHQATLRSIIEADLANPDGWILHPDGSYHQGEAATHRA